MFGAHTRGVAFDMDGLMVNTEELYSEVGEILLSRRDRRFSSELKAAMMGLPGPQAFAVMIERERLSDTHTTLALESDEIFVELLLSKLQTLPGLEELPSDSTGCNYRDVSRPVARITSSSVLEIVELEDRFDFVVTAEDVEHGKPAPDIYVEARVAWGIDAPGVGARRQSSWHASWHRLGSVYRRRAWRSQLRA
ncbi:MAG: HAD hydrolase-like protein [Pirellulaceae bacterium]